MNSKLARAPLLVSEAKRIFAQGFSYGVPSKLETAEDLNHAVEADPAESLDWIVAMTTEFSNPDEPLPTIQLATGAQLCYAPCASTQQGQMRVWLEGSDAEIRATFQRDQGLKP